MILLLEPRPSLHDYILLADMPGFDAYVTQVELEQANDAMGDSLSHLVSRLISPPEKSDAGV